MSQNTREDAPAGRKALALEGLAPEALYREGTQYFKARDYDSSCACFERYVSQRPDDPAGQYFLARAYYHQNKDFDRAEECIKRAIELDPASETRYLETLGTIYIQIGDYARAEEVFAYALSADKKDNKRHTYSLEFYLNLVRKKNKKTTKHHKPEMPVFIKTDVDRWHERNRQPLFLVPSILVHLLAFLVIWFISSHDLTIKETKEDFTYVDIEKPSEPEPGEKAAPNEQEEAGRPASEPSPEEQAAPAPAVPRKDVQTSDVSKESAQAAGGSPAAKVQGEAGRKQTVGQKSMAGVKAGGQADSAAVKGVSSEKTVGVKGRAITAYQPDVDFARKGMGEASQAKGMAGGKEASVGRMADRQAAAPAGGGEGIFLGDRGQTRDSKWSKEKAAGMKSGSTDANAPDSTLKATEKSLAVGRAGKKAMASKEEPGAFKPMPLGMEGQGQMSAARPGGQGAVGGIEKGASSATVRGGQGLNAGQDRTDGVSPSGKVKGSLGVPVASQQNTNLGALGGERKPDFDSKAGVRKFASAEPLPGKRGLNIAGQPAQSGAQGRQGAGREGAPAGVERGQAAAPQGAAGIQNARPGGEGGRPGAVGGKAAAARAIGSGGQDTGGEGFFESAAKKMTAALGLGGKGVRPGGSPSEADLRKPKSLSGIGGGAAQGSGSGPGGAGSGRGQGLKIGGGEKTGSGPASPSAAVAAGQQSAGSSVYGSKKMTEGALGVPGGSGQERYASAGRGEARPGGTEKQSGVSRAGKTVARNTLGPAVAITSPKPGRTNRLSQVITGTVSDARTRKATITVNNESKVISVERGSFEAVVALSKGRNTVTVMAFDIEGNVGKDSIALDYSEPSEGPPVTIISPRDGQVFDVSERSVVSVKGTVGDQDVKRAKLIFNGNPMDISVNRGYFEQKVALVQEQNTVLVEAASADGGVSRSKLINIGTVNVKPKDIMLILTWDKPHADMDMHVYGPLGGHTSYKTPSIYESKEAIAGAQLEQDAKGNFGPEVFTQDRSDKGVYTVKSNYFYSGGDGNANATVTVILYGDNPSRRIVRVFGPHLQVDTKSGEDVWDVTKFKMPEGIFLEE